MQAVRPTSPARTLALLASVALFVFSVSAHAVPSFARQTGLQCSACHTVFPQLTPLGRQFKLTGYTMTKSTTEQSKQLQEEWLPPLSVMLQISATFTDEKQPDTQNGNVLFPQEMSLFYAGRMADKAGAFVQTTYEGTEDHFTFDHADIRAATETTTGGGKSLVYGLTLNNAPTVEDVWNSTPIWGYPYASSDVAPAPIADTLLTGGLDQQVGGLGIYGFWNDSLYAEVALYRAAQIGQPQPPDATSSDTVDGNAPYWRLAYEHNWGGDHYLEVGTYGLIADIFPRGVSGPTDRYRDTAIDAQYQLLTEAHTLTIHGTYIREERTLDATFPVGAANDSLDLESCGINVTYYRQRRYGGTIGYFQTTGDSDSLLYVPAPITGSRAGKPDTNGWIAELDYLPRENIKLALQYTLYDKFNGASSDYDGTGRDASDNNTLYLNSWFNF